LRERREDVAHLAGHFLKVFATEMGMTPPTFSGDALENLKAHTFPGNVRELKNLIERALILSGGDTIRREHLQLIASPDASFSQTAPTSVQIAASLPLDLEEAEHVLIQRALEQTGGNVAEAARLLKVNRSRIYRRFPHLAGGKTT
jgi:DNA-binding NtrC family response regulator